MTTPTSALCIAAGPLDLLAATADQMAALMGPPAEFHARYGLAVAPGFLEPAEAATILGVCREALLLDPARLLWWSRLAILRGERRLVGFGGYKGLPRDGVVEIGYQIAPAWRGRGLATAMARGLVTHAWRTPRVTAVIAHTAPEASASTHILGGLGFRHLGESVDDRFPDSRSWLWRLDRV